MKKYALSEANTLKTKAFCKIEEDIEVFNGIDNMKSLYNLPVVYSISCISLCLIMFVKKTVC